ncbi:MAG TPA: MotA/TolQ/ExbB proton channel family protein [Candidatus Syntrophosphaera sp.]|nr:MAG: Biopolymer transport protein ExbB [Candidatus Cloacimonetes bacterium ADurb.Bin211]HOD60028.1 MotA/TolQ/ExbB proton channel family protein [Candidatus Syntrophosphaera sp.]HQM79807.1 MotA/TolQ/ExbB proton channel family protein [Candidatus Syntrophosphaera sp.]
MSLLDFIMRGGFLMYVLVAISVIIIAIVIEKYYQIHNVRKNNEKLSFYLAQQDKLENIRAVLRIHGQNSPLGSMLDKLYNAETDDIDLIQESMESIGNRELHNLEKGMDWLSTLSAIAPLVGFLGTVIGMVQVFMNIQGQGQNTVDINTLAGGIWVALLTTVGGLVVGIPAIIFYNNLVQKLEDLAKDMQHEVVEHEIKYRKMIKKA